MNERKMNSRRVGGGVLQAGSALVLALGLLAGCTSEVDGIAGAPFLPDEQGDDAGGDFEVGRQPSDGGSTIGDAASTPDGSSQEGRDADELEDEGPDEPDAGPDAPDGPVPNEGWIGGACQGAAQCDYDDARCLTEAEGYPDGLCSLDCDRICPDRDGTNSVTFCATDPEGQGRCVSRCDEDLYPGGGCREGYDCRVTPRAGQPEVQVGACVPEGWPGGPEATSVCLQRLEDAGVAWVPWGHTPTSPEGTRDVCVVEDPIRVSGLVGGVTWRYYSSQQPAAMAMGCPLAVSMLRLGAVLREYGITQVLHLGTYNCRTISGTSTLSQHSFGLAVDIYGLVDDQGRDYILERDWEHDTDSPTTREAQLLHEIAQRMYEERIFNIILTPNYNTAHDNHFHVDLTEGSHFIGYGGTPGRYIGPNQGH